MAEAANCGTPCAEKRMPKPLGGVPFLYGRVCFEGTPFLVVFKVTPNGRRPFWGVRTPGSNNWITPESTCDGRSLTRCQLHRMNWDFLGVSTFGLGFLSKNTPVACNMFGLGAVDKQVPHMRVNGNYACDICSWELLTQAPLHARVVICLQNPACQSAMSEVLITTGSCQRIGIVGLEFAQKDIRSCIKHHFGLGGCANKCSSDVCVLITKGPGVNMQSHLGKFKTYPQINFN